MSAEIDKTVYPLYYAGIFAPYTLMDFFNRMEFQMRGSPHLHGIYWIKNAPKYKEGDEESKRLCIEFIDQLITCERSEDEEIRKYIGYQLHKHSSTCHKGVGKKKCRFGFPKPPLQHTAIVVPLDQKVSKKIRDRAKANFQRIQDYLKDKRDTAANPNFPEFLAELELTENEYTEGYLINLDTLKQ